MHDMLPRKPTAAVPEIKKGFKDSLYVNGMNTSTSPALISPVPSGGSPSPGEDGSSGMNMKSTSDSPQHLLKKKNDDRLMNSSPSFMQSMMPKPLTSSATASPLSSPGIGPLSAVGRGKTSPKHKLRRNESADSKLKNQIFNFDGNNSVENNFCANNNNNSKRNGKFALQQRQRRLPLKTDDQSRASSRNSVSDELSSSSLTPTTDEQATSIPPGQNLDSLFDNVEVDDEMFNKVLNESAVGNLFQDAADDLPEFDAVVSSFQNPDPFMFDGNTNSLRTLSQTGDLPTLEGGIMNSMDSTHSSSTAVPSSGINSGQGFHSTTMPSSVSPTSFQKDSATSAPDVTRKIGTSHLQDILGVTDTIRLKNMSRPIDSVPYTSPTTTTSYSAGMKSLPTPPCTMVPPGRLPNMTSPFNKPRQQMMFNNENSVFRPNSQGFMDNGANNGPWNRGSPRNGIPHMMKSPQLSAPYVENSSMSPSGVNPMSGLQSTVDSIPAAPHGLSEPGTPIMGPPLGIDATPSPGGSKMRPPPSPSVSNDKRCVSADSVSAASNGKKSGGKRERTRSADSKDEEKKEMSVPKNKRRKSRVKDENTAGKKSTESKTPGRNLSSNEEEKLFRQDSALSGLLDVQTSNPYLYIFNTDAANKAAEEVRSNNVPHIILFHQSYLGNCKLRPSQFYKPKMSVTPKSEMTTTVSDAQSMSMPTTSWSPTEISTEKTDPNKSPKIELSQNFPENIQSINLEDMKPPMLPPPVSDISNMIKSETGSSQPMPSTQTSQNGNQEELSAEKRRHREDKLDKLRKIQERFTRQGSQGEQGYPSNNIVHHPAGWLDKPVPMQQYRGPMGPRMQKMTRQDVKEIPISAPEGMMRHGGGPGQMVMPENEWHQLVQNYNAEKRRRHEAGMAGDLPSRPPPPYEMNGPQPRWMIQEGYPIEHRMQMEQMNRPRLQRMNSGPRPMLRMPQDVTRMPGGYMPQRMGIPHGPYPHPHPSNLPPQQRMPVYDQYLGPRNMRHPSRLPHPATRQSSSENYPFSEQLMKQARYYNTNMPPYQTEPGMSGEWSGPEGSQRLSHMPGSSPSPGLGPPVMIPMEVNPRMTPGMPPNRGYDHMGPYIPEMGHPQRYDMLMPMGSPTAPMDARTRGPSGVGSMMDAIARRGAQRPPDLNLNSQLPPRSPMNSMNYHGQGPMPSPSVNPMNPPVGAHFCNPGEMGHPPHASPMQGCTRSPSIGMGQPMGPASAGVDAPSQMMMVRGGPHSAGPLSNPPNDWPGPNPNMPGTPTVNSGMIQRMMTPQPTNMATQPGMMSSQSGMMAPQQPLQQPGMMSPPAMMSQPVMMTSQPQGIPRMPNSQSGKYRQSTISLMVDRLSSFKMPEKSPLYQDAVKDTASPPLIHPNDPSLVHNPMRVSVSNHPPTYDARIVHQRMVAPHMGEGFQQQGYSQRHASPMSAGPMPGSSMMMNPARDPMPPPCDYQQQRSNFPEMPDFDLRNILPSERPSQTISYLPPENNSDQFPSPGWGMEGIRPQLMQGPTHPTGPGRPLI